MPTFRTNVTNKQQNDLEEATFEGGVPVFADAERRQVNKQMRGGASRVIGASGGTPASSSSGVVIPHDDQPGRFLSDTVGRP